MIMLVITGQITLRTNDNTNVVLLPINTSSMVMKLAHKLGCMLMNNNRELLSVHFVSLKRNM